MILWVLVQTKGSRETYAAANCARQGYKTFLPMIWDDVKREPVVMFPSYLFVETRGHYSSLESTYGVSRLIRPTDKSPASPVPKGLVKALRSLKIKKGIKRGCIELPEGGLNLIGGPSKFKKPIREGMPVTINAGAFLGTCGLVKETSKDDRVKVLFELMGKNVSTWFDVADVVAA